MKRSRRAEDVPTIQGLTPARFAEFYDYDPTGATDAATLYAAWCARYSRLARSWRGIGGPRAGEKYAAAARRARRRHRFYLYVLLICRDHAGDEEGAAAMRAQIAAAERGVVVVEESDG